jgi:hypothetical protein
MTERSLDAINADVERLKNEASSAATVLSRPAGPDAATVNAAYQDSQMLAFSVLGLGVFVLCCLTYLFKAGRRFDDLLRSFVTILIVVSAVFLVVAGYSEKQIAPVIGLLGTIAGYVLGKSDQRRDDAKEKIAKTDG